MKSTLISILICSTTILAQIPDTAFQPMTAPGAHGIDWNDHILYWENPSGI